MIAKSEWFQVNALMSEDSQASLHDHYRLLLGLIEPWEMAEADPQWRNSKVEARVEWPRGKSPECPEYGEACDIHDHAPESRWRHLDTMHPLGASSQTSKALCSTSLRHLIYVQLRNPGSSAERKRY